MIASAAVAVTATELEVPVMEAVTVSVAVMVWLPELSKVNWKFPCPPASDPFAGRTAFLSELVMRTVPL